MGCQLIIAVEADNKCKSDWIYIKDTIDEFYSYDYTQTKFSPVYMGGKGNYKKKQKSILKLISQYASTSKNNKSKVIYCFDCDDYDKKQDDIIFLKDVKQFCKSNGYEFVWFCKDVESVYIGKKVDDSQKKKEAATFKAKKAISNVDIRNLMVQQYNTNTSNIMCVLDSILCRKL